MTTFNELLKKLIESTRFLAKCSRDRGDPFEAAHLEMEVVALEGEYEPEEKKVESEPESYHQP